MAAYTTPERNNTGWTIGINARVIAQTTNRKRGIFSWVSRTDVGNIPEGMAEGKYRRKELTRSEKLKVSENHGLSWGTERTGGRSSAGMCCLSECGLSPTSMLW